MSNPPDVSQMSPSEDSETGNWIMMPNASVGGWTYIMLPAAGTLVINYQAIQPAEQIYVFHRNGPNTPINFGENTIDVSLGDAILYQLANPGTDSIKLIYQLK